MRDSFPRTLTLRPDIAARAPLTYVDDKRRTQILRQQRLQLEQRQPGPAAAVGGPELDMRNAERSMRRLGLGSAPQ